MLTRKKVVLPAAGFADLTDWVAECAAACGDEGLCIVQALDPRAGIVIGDGDPRAQKDLLDDMERAFPERASYESADGPARAAAAAKSTVFGAEKWLPVAGGALRLGESQRVLAVSYSGEKELELAVATV